MSFDAASLAPQTRAIAKTLPKHVEKSVLVIGKVDQINGTEVTLQLSDGKIIAHVGDAIPPLEMGAVYEFMGKVVDDSSIKVLGVVESSSSELPEPDIEEGLLNVRAGIAGAAIFR